MKKILFLFAIVLFTYQTNATDLNGNDKDKNGKTLFELSGQVIDQKSGEVLPGVCVVLPSLNQKTFTDLDGNFYFNAITEEELSVEVKFISYKEIKTNVNLKEIDQKLIIKLENN